MLGSVPHFQIGMLCRIAMDCKRKIHPTGAGRRGQSSISGEDQPASVQIIDLAASQKENQEALQETSHWPSQPMAVQRC